jgi:hypothetical protein
VRVYGIDFSGARDAGRRIWIAEGVADSGRLVIRRGFPLVDLPGSPLGREVALRALTSFIADLDPVSVVGIDAPFGLPLTVYGGARWRETIAFVSRYEDAAAFRRACVAAAAGRELRRETDCAARTPFSPYNLRLYRQTFHALRDVLGPLVGSDNVRVAPMEETAAAGPTVIEVCPASTLKHLGLYAPYKGRVRAAARTRLVSALEQAAPLRIEPRVRARAVADPGGDALDSIVAALAAHRASEHAKRPPGSAWRVEGFVYV